MCNVNFTAQSTTVITTQRKVCDTLLIREVFLRLKSRGALLQPETSTKYLLTGGTQPVCFTERSTYTSQHPAALKAGDSYFSVTADKVKFKL